MSRRKEGGKWEGLWVLEENGQTQQIWGGKEVLKDGVWFKAACRNWDVSEPLGEASGSRVGR